MYQFLIIAYLFTLLTSQTAGADDPPILDNIRQDNVCDMLNMPISDQKIQESVYSLKSDKSPSPDEICAEIYKITLDYICPYIRLMFNDLFDRGQVPDSFWESIIIPIHKSGSFDVPGNFRDISLINTFCKIFMGIMNTRLQNWCDEFGVIDEAQAGFRKNYSTIDNIFCLHALGQKYLSKPKRRFYCLFIKLFILVGLGQSFFVCCLAHRDSTVGFLLLQCSSGIVRHPRDLQVSVATHFCRVLIFASS